MTKALAIALLLATASTSVVYAERMKTTNEAEIPAVAPLKTLPTYNSVISAWYKADVYDPKENKVGEVKDMLVNADGTINAVMLSVGGFLGMGEKDVAVPMNAIRIAQRDGKWWLTINADKQVLKDAPGYRYERRTAQWEPVNNRS